MLKYLFSAFSFILCLLFATAAYAEEEKIMMKTMKVDNTGKIVVDESESLDGNAYVLNEADKDENYTVMLSNATTFINLDYNFGFFDNPTVNYKVSGGSINAAIDNSLKTRLNSSKMGQTITFDTPIQINAHYASGYASDIRFYNKNVLVKTVTPTNVTPLQTYEPIEIDRIHFVYEDYDAKYLYELEIFVYEPIEYISVSNLKVNNIKDSTASVTFTNPDGKHFKHNDILLNGVKIAGYNGQSAYYQLNDLTQETEYEVTIRSYYSDGKFVDAIATFKTKKDMTAPLDVTDLVAVQQGDTVKLTWTKPPDADLSHYKIIRNGLVLQDNVKDEEFIDTKPIYNANVNYRVQSVDKNKNQSTGKVATIKPVGKEIYNLTAKAKKFDEVELQWQNPERQDFELVTIYRKDPPATQTFAAKIVSLFSGAEDEYKSLFETNGTIFKDLTVQADTSYSYLLKTTINNKESDGVTVTVKTPKVSVIGGGTEETSDSYVIKWDKPVTGQMLVRVGGVDYKTVPAADKQIIIPKKDMKYDFMNNIDVQLIPISDDGTVGNPTKPGGGNAGGGGLPGGTGGSTPVTADDTLKLAVQMLGIVGMFILLGLGFRVVPKLVTVIKNAYIQRIEQRGEKR